MEFLAGLYTLLLVIICLLLAVVLWKLNKPRNGGDYEELKRWMQQQLDAQAKDFAARQAAMAEQNYTAIRSVSETLQTSVQSMSTTLAQGQSGQQQILTQRLQSLEAANTQKLEELRKTLAENMTALQAENAKKLDEIRHTVDEQLQDALQKRVTESFKAVNDQLEQVYKGLGEMQNLAADVGGLKQVLSGVKTRGILGEIQLGAILEEILAPEQYETNVATIPGSTQRVEYAIKMPGADGGTVWLPIDSKFPGDTYAHLQDAQASGDAQAVENARHALELVLRSEAKDIREKYVEPPYTTTFGILFLPFEGLYAEVVNAGLLEVLQRDYQVNIAGPSTMATACRWASRPLPSRSAPARSGSCWVPLRRSSTSSGRGSPRCSSVCARPMKSWTTSLVSAAGPSAASSAVSRAWMMPAQQPCWSWTTSRADRWRHVCRRMGKSSDVQNIPALSLAIFLTMWYDRNCSQKQPPQKRGTA